MMGYKAGNPYPCAASYSPAPYDWIFHFQNLPKLCILVSVERLFDYLCNKSKILQFGLGLSIL